MLIDCNTCIARDRACRDCVVTVLLERPRIPVEFDEAEEEAIGSLASAGLVPPLRLVSGTTANVREIA